MASNVFDFLPSLNRSEVPLKLDPKKFEAVGCSCSGIFTISKKLFCFSDCGGNVSESCAKFSQLIIISILAKIKVFGLLLATTLRIDIGCHIFNVSVPLMQVLYFVTAQVGGRC